MSSGPARPIEVGLSVKEDDAVPTVPPDSPPAPIEHAPDGMAVMLNPLGPDSSAEKRDSPPPAKGDSEPRTVKPEPAGSDWALQSRASAEYLRESTEQAHDDEGEIETQQYIQDTARQNKNRAVLIVLSVVVVLVAVTAMMWTIWLLNADDAARPLARSSLGYVSDGLSLSVKDYVTNVSAIVGLMDSYYQRGQADFFSTTSDGVKFATYYAVLTLNDYPDIDGVWVGTTAGGLVGAIRYSSACGALPCGVVQDATLTSGNARILPITQTGSNCPGSTCVYTYSMDFNTYVAEVRARLSTARAAGQVAGYSVTSQSWYTAGIAQSGRQWETSASLSEFTGALQQYHVLRIDDSTGTTKGVAVSYIESKHMNYLMSFYHPSYGISYVADQTGTLVGFSDLEGSTITSLTDVTAYADKSVSTTSSGVYSSIGSNWDSLTTYSQVGYVAEYNTDTVAAFSFTDTYGLRLLIFSVLTHYEVYGDESAYALAGIIICVLGVIGLCVWAYFPIREKFFSSDEDKKGDESRDKFVESQTRKAVIFMSITMLVLVVIWLGWSIVSTDAVYKAVRTCLLSSAQYSLESTEFTVMMAHEVNALQSNDWELQLQRFNDLAVSDPLYLAVAAFTRDQCAATLATSNLDQMFCDYLDSYPDLSYAYIGFPNGYFIGCGRTSSDTTSTWTGKVIAVADASTNYLYTEYEYDTSTKQRTANTLYTSTYKYAATARPWYITGLAVYQGLSSSTYPTGAYWSDVYSYAGADAKAGISNVRPITYASGLAGIFGADLALADISTSLSNGALDPDGDGRSWIVQTHSASMIGASTIDESVVSSSRDQATVSAYAYGDSSISSQSQTIAGWFSYDWSSSQGYFQAKGDPVMKILRVGMPVDLDWTQVVTASYDYFYSTSDSQQYLSFVLLLVGFILMAFILVAVVTYLKDDRLDVVERRVFEDFGEECDEHDRAKEEKRRKDNYEELERLKDLRTYKWSYENYEQNVRLKAAELVCSTMRFLKEKMVQNYARSQHRSNSAIEFLSEAQRGDGGVDRLIMLQHAASVRGFSSKHLEHLQDSYDDYTGGDESSASASNGASSGTLFGQGTSSTVANKDDQVDDEAEVWDLQKAKRRSVLAFMNATMTENPNWQCLMVVLIYLFIAFEYASASDDGVVLGLEFTVIMVLLLDAGMDFYFTLVQRKELNMPYSWLKALNLGSVILNVIFLIVKACGYADPLRFTRPWMLLWRERKVFKALILFFLTIYQSFSVFLVFFMTIIVSAVLALLLFRTEMTNCETCSDQPSLDDFMDSFKEMFVLVATGENYADIVPAALELSDWYFFFFVVWTLIGLFLLGSLLIATFQSQYNAQVVEMTMIEKERLFNGVAPTFCLWTYNLPGARLDKLPDRRAVSKEEYKEQLEDTLENKLTIQRKSFTMMMAMFWESENQKAVLLKLCEHQQKKRVLNAKIAERKAQRVKLERVKLEREVNRMDPEPVSQHDLEKMKGVMLDYSGRVFDLLDINESNSIDFTEFAEICTYLKLMPELHFNEVFHKMMSIVRLDMTKKQLEDGLETPEVTLSLDERNERQDRLKMLLQRRILLDYELKKAQRVAQDQFYGATEADGNKIVTAVTAVQLLFLASYGTKINEEFLNFLAVAFTSAHAVDMVLRVIQLKGVFTYLRWGRNTEPETKLQRQWQFCFVCISFFGLVFYLIDRMDSSFADRKETQALQMIMALSTFRCLVTVPQFSALLYSVSTGIEPVTVYFTLLLFFMYLFATLGYVLFRDLEVPSHDEQNYWSTPFNALATIMQLLVGEGWNGVMDWTVTYTYKIVMGYFMLYVMIATILFTQLFLGIFIELFERNEESRAESMGELYVILRNFCPDKPHDDLRKLVFGIMSAGVSLENYDNESYEHCLHQIHRIQCEWRLRQNWKLYTTVQQEVHPLCSLLLGKFPHDKEITKYMSRTPMNAAFVHVDEEAVEADSWFEQHFLVKVLHNRFTMFTKLTHTRLGSGMQVFELCSFLCAQLRLFSEFVNIDEDIETLGPKTVLLTDLSEALLESYEDYVPGNELSIFNDIVLHGDLTVIIPRLKATGLDLSRPGDRMSDDGIASTVEEDLLEAARESITWQHQGENTVMDIFSSLNKPRDGELYQSGEEMDMNTSEIHDQERLEIWQQLIVYTTMAAQKNRVYGKYAEESKSGKAAGKSAEASQQDARRDGEEKWLSSDVANPQAVRELDTLARIVRLRALISRAEFGNPWNFAAFAHWFLDAFYLPIAKVWL